MFKLLGLGRIKGLTAPNLLIPIFGSQTSNYTYTHELDRFLVIQRFIRCDTAFIDIIPFKMARNVVAGTAGLVAFEIRSNECFVGTLSELNEWWNNNSNLLNEATLLRAIIVEIVGSSDVAKYKEWREYLRSEYGTSNHVAEATDAKFAQISGWGRLWEEMAEDDKIKLDSEDEYLRALLRQKPETIIAWIEDPENFTRPIWRRTWEFADRHLLLSDTSGGIIEAYLKHCIFEAPEALLGDIAYFTRRSFGFVGPGDDDYTRLLRDFFALGVPILRRSRLEASDIRSYMTTLSKGDSAAICDLVIDVINQTNYLEEDMEFTYYENDYDVFDFRNLEVMIAMLRDADPSKHLRREDVLSLVYFFQGLLTSKISRATKTRLSRVLNSVLKPFGIDTAIIRRAYRADTPATLISEMIVSARPS